MKNYFGIVSQVMGWNRNNAYTPSPSFPAKSTEEKAYRRKCTKRKKKIKKAKRR